jgi:hypothetical protein
MDIEYILVGSSLEYFISSEHHEVKRKREYVRQRLNYDVSILEDWNIFAYYSTFLFLYILI